MPVRKLTALAVTGALVAACGAIDSEGASARGPSLTVARAKRVARSRAWRFDWRVERVKVSWFNRWSRREVHVGVTGEWTDYVDGCDYGYYDGCSSDGYTTTSSCDATVRVWVTRRGRVRSRVERLSCFY